MRTALASFFVFAAIAQGQPPVNVPPVPAAPAADAAANTPAAPSITSADPQVQAIVKLLTGSFRAPAAGTQPELVLHAAVVNVTGLDNAVYFELHRADTPDAAFSQGILHVFRQNAPAPEGSAAGSVEQLMLRVYGFTRLSSTFADAVVGLWQAPDAFPPIKSDQLAPIVDVVLQPQGDGAFAGRSTLTPFNQHGASQLLSAWRISTAGVSIKDVGLKPDGTEAFGPTAGQPESVFVRFEAPTAVNRLAGGVVAIDLVPGDGPAADDGDDIAMHYRGFLASDGFEFDASISNQRPPILVTLPVGNFIQGWSIALPGQKMGQVRRLVIPSAMAYGEAGRRSARIPPNATLIFETRVVYYKDKPAPPPPPPPAPEGGQPAGTSGVQGSPTPPTAQPASSGTPK